MVGGERWSNWIDQSTADKDIIVGVVGAGFEREDDYVGIPGHPEEHVSIENK